MIPWIGSAGGAAGASAAGAAAARARMLSEEEEILTMMPNEGYGDYEFKIIRNNFNAFDKPDKMRAALEEEARAGWELVEKFDGNRIRLRRPIACREQDHTLDFNPYRTTLGMTDTKLALVIIGVIFGALAFVGLLVALLKNQP